MKKFQEYGMIILGLVLLAGGLLLLKIVAEPQGVMLTLPYICVGLGCGIFGQGMGSVVSRKALQNHPEEKRQVEIEINDERNQNIAYQSKARAYDMMIFVFGALMISLALMKVDLRAVLLLVFAYLFVIGYGIYWRSRLEKEM